MKKENDIKGRENQRCDLPHPAQHIDRMLQLVVTHHAQISSMADVKASMLITAASLVMTVLISGHLTNFGSLSQGLLIVGCVATISVATYATMPQVKLRSRKQEPVAVNGPSFDILFFGHFTRLDYPDFHAHMVETMRDHNQVYDALVKEIYLTGTYLANGKYRLLRIAYIAFLAGIITSGIASILPLLAHR